MREINDGGPAFPPQDRVLVTPAVLNEEQIRMLKDALAHAQSTGMALRDYFAAAVLNTLIYKCEDKDGGWDYVSVAVGAYGLADAMLEAREVKS